MQIYTFMINGQKYRLYGEMFDTREYNGGKYTIYHDYKGLEWLHITHDGSDNSLLPWKKFGKVEEYLKFLFN